MKYTDMTKEQLLGKLKKMEQGISELKASERQYRDILESLGDAISIQDAGFKILYQNQASKDLMGNHAGEFCYLAYERKETVCKGCPLSLTLQDGMRHTSEIKLTDAQGKSIYVEINSSALKDEAGNIVGGVEAARNIAERRKSEKTVCLEETKYRSIVEQSLAGIYILQDGRFPYVNPKFAEILGYTPDEVISSLSLNDIVFEEDRKLVTENMRKYFEGNGETVHHIFRGKRKDGILVELEAQGAGTEFNGKPAIIGIILDITERKKMEVEVLKMQKLESLSAFASAIAHEYNNLLTAIIGNLSLAKMYAKPGYEVYDVLAEAEKASIRAKDLTAHLLTFSEDSRPAKKIVHLDQDLKKWVASVLAESLMKPEFAIQKNLWPIEADALQIQQVIDSIVINARQAMPGGGLIEVRAENIVIDTPPGLPLTEGRYVLISIEDHGIGISEKYLQKIFDPFSTTKQKSSGLGLSSAYAIIKMHKGHITVDSKPGVGTIFRIYLPAFQEKIAPPEGLFKTYPPGKGRILVMDDEEIVSLVVSKLLSQCGYETELARDGEEMLRMYKEAMGTGQPFDSVIMDLVIEGGMGGQEAIKDLLELDPQAKAIVSSGYSNAPVMSHFREFGFIGFLAKPYRLEELANVLHKVLTRNEE